MLFVNRLYHQIESYFRAHSVWLNTYGFARSIIAFGSLSNLIFNSTSVLFRPHLGLLEVPSCSELNGFSLYCIFSNNLEIARIIAIASLLVVISGWRPKVTGVLHWYITFSLTATATVLDGGDHIATILTFLMIPICLTDNRAWHWAKPKKNNHDYLATSIIAFSSVLVIRIQMALVYLHAASAKLSVVEWQDGTAVYYWFTHPTFGVSGWLQPVFIPLLQNGFIVTGFTWGTIVLEFLLFAGLLASDRLKKKLFIAGVIFHLGILLIHGLFSFFFSMLGGLVLYLLPLHNELVFPSRKFNPKIYDNLKI